MIQDLPEIETETVVAPTQDRRFNKKTTFVGLTVVTGVIGALGMWYLKRNQTVELKVVEEPVLEGEVKDGKNPKGTKAS